MTRRYKKSELRLAREWAKELVEELIDCKLLCSNELELRMVKSEFNMLIDTLIIEKIRNTE